MQKRHTASKNRFFFGILNISKLSELECKNYGKLLNIPEQKVHAKFGAFSTKFTFDENT